MTSQSSGLRGAANERATGGNSAPLKTLEVSILVKTLNEATKIETCLESCLAALQGIDGEIIVADSLSADATVAIAANYPVRVVQLARRRDRGCGVGAQLAYQHSSGRFVYVLDGDMQVNAAFLREALRHMAEHPRVAGVGGQLEEGRPESDLVRIRRRHRRPAHAGAGPVAALKGGGLYRREAIDDAGGYLTHPSLHAHEELELGLRLRDRGWSLVRLAVPAVRHDGHADPAFRLLLRRWRSGYARGPGEILRAAWGARYFAAVAMEFRLEFLSIIGWLLLAVALLALPVSPWPLVAMLGTLLALVLTMATRKRSLYFGVYALAAWQVYAAGLLVGAWAFRRGLPTRRIECVAVPAGPASAELPPIAAAEPTAAQSAVANPYGSKAVKKGLLHYMSGRLYTGGVQLVLVALFVRHMVVTEYAAYTTLGALAGLIASLTLFGLERASMRYVPQARLSGNIEVLSHLVRTLTLVRLAVLLCAVGLILVLAEPALELFQLEGHLGTLWVALLYLVASSTTRYQRYTLQSLMLQRDLTLGLTLAITVRLAIVLLIVWQFDTMSAAWGLGAMALTEWLQATWQWWVYRKHLRVLKRDPAVAAGQWKPDFAEIRRYALVNGYSTTLRQLTGKNSLRLIGATYLSPGGIAAFGFFQALAERLRPYLPVFLSRTLIEPVAMAYYLREHDFAGFNRVMSVMLKMNLLFIAPLTVWLTLSGGPAIGALTGGKFLEYAWIMPVILLSLVSVSHWALIELTANAVGASALLAKGSTLAAVLTLGVLVLTQPRSGVLGLVLTGLLTTLIGNLFVVWRLRAAGHRYRIDIGGSLRIVGAAVFGGVSGYVCVRLVGLSGAPAGSLLAFVVMLLAFGVGMRLVPPFPPEERDIVQRMLPRRLKWMCA